MIRNANTPAAVTLVGLALTLPGCPGQDGRSARPRQGRPAATAGTREMDPMAFPDAYKPEATARAELRRYLYEFDPRTDGVPKRIDPKLVERFLQEELAKGRLKRGQSARAVELADFYEAHGVVPVLMRLLDRGENSEVEFLVSVAFTRAIGILGNDSQREFGRQYFRHLLALPYAETRMPELLDCLAVYDSEELTAATLQRMDAILNALRSRAATDATAGTRLRDFEDLRNGTPPRIEAARALQREIAGAGDPAVRLDNLVNIYLGLDMRYYAWMSRWAVRTLLREARTGGAGAVIAAFRRSLPRVTGEPPLDEAARLRRARVFHAIEFFGGTLDAAEAKETQPAVKRFDLLSND
jgi:hypothetical protein